MGACLGGLALLLSGCSSSSTPSSSAVTVSGSTLHVYISVPPGPAQSGAQDVVDAERLAFTQSDGRAGTYKLSLVTAHDSEVSANARQAVQDKTAIAYLGEIDPGTSSVSVPITNQVGLLQISPTDTAENLTHDTSSNLYPSSSTYHRTFARVVPNTAQEAKAIVTEMQAQHLSKLYVTNDGELYGSTIAQEVRSDASAHGLTVVSSPVSADVVFCGATAADADGQVEASPGGVAAGLLARAASASPNAKLFVPSGLDDGAFLSKLSSAVSQKLYISVPGFARSALTPAGKQFASAFQSSYGHAPQPQAIFGYEAMSALIGVLKGLGAHANSRADVVSRFEGLKNPSGSVLGAYSLSGGDTSLAPSFVFLRPSSVTQAAGSQG